MNTRGIFAALFGAVLMLGSSPGMALDPTFQIAAKNIQRVPTSFKFQAAISQAKMPVGEAVFQTLIVNLKKGDQVMCSETFNDVQVRDSVLNLDIGKQMSCDMDAVMAEHSGLTFQVCIGGAENCLKPVELGTVPYAVKSNFAVQAQEAHTSDVAVQSHYAHRVTADRDLFESQGESIGAGYFDFYTEDSDTLATSLETLDTITLSDTHRTEDLSVAGHLPVGTDGYISWVPTTGDTLGHVLNICARDLNTDMPAMLERLVFHSNLITLRGAQEVFGNSVTTGDVDIGGALEVFSNADFYDDVNVEENLHVKMESDLDLAVRANYTLTVTDHTQLNSTLTTEGATQLNSTLTVEDATQLNNTLTVAADQATTLGGTLTVADNKASTLGGTLLVKETSTLTGNVAALANVAVTGDTSVGNDLSVTNQSTLTGNVYAQSNLDVTGDASVGNDLSVTSQSTLTGNVYAQSDLDVTGNSSVGGDASVIGNTTLNGNVAAQANLTVEGATNLNNNVNIAAGQTLTNAGHTQLDHTLTVASGKATTLGGSLTVAEGQSSTFNGDVSVGADDTLTVNGTTSLQGSLTALGQVTVGQEGQEATAMSIYHNVNFLGDVTIPSDSISYNFGDQQIVYSQNIVNGEVKTNDLDDNAVTRAKIANDAIGTDQVALNSLTAGDLATDSVTHYEIETNAVRSDEIQADAVGSSEIAADAVGNAEMADNAIGSAEVIANSLTAADLAADSVASSEIAAGAVGTSELANDAVVGGTGGDIKDESITSADIGNGTIASVDLASNSVTAAQIAAGAVGASELADNAVGMAQIANDAVGWEEIATSGVLSEHVLDGTLTADDLAANSVTASEIASGAVGYTEIATDAVRAAEIQAGAVGTSEVADNSLTASDLAASSVGSSEIATGAVRHSELDLEYTHMDTYTDGSVTSGRLWLMDNSASSSSSDRIVTLSGNTEGGLLYLYNRDTTPQLKARLMVKSNDTGRFTLFDSSGDTSHSLYSESYGGRMYIYDSGGDEMIFIGSTNSGATSRMYTYDLGRTDGALSTAMGQYGSGDGYGYIYLYDDDAQGDNKEKHWATTITKNGSTDYGGWSAWGKVYNTTSDTWLAKIYVNQDYPNGRVWAGSKNFVVDHPMRSDKVIVYHSYESSKPDYYHRGTARLENGYAEIALPEHFSVLALEEDMTAVLTPRSAESLGLAVLTVKPDRLVVKELHNGKGNYEFDYSVVAIRNDIPDEDWRDPVQDWDRYRGSPETGEHTEEDLYYKSNITDTKAEDLGE